MLEKGENAGNVSKTFFCPEHQNMSLCSLRVNLFPNKPWFLGVSSTSLLKALWEKEKLLVTSNFSFSHSVFFYLFGEHSVVFIKFEIFDCKLFSLEESKICCLGKGSDMGLVWAFCNLLNRC